MAPKRVSKVAKKAPVQTYPNGEPKVKWIHFAPAHSKTRPWRIQITGMVRFFNFYFVLLKLYSLFPFVRRRNIPSPRGCYAGRPVVKAGQRLFCCSPLSFACRVKLSTLRKRGSAPIAFVCSPAADQASCSHLVRKQLGRFSLDLLCFCGALPWAGRQYGESLASS